MYNIILGYKLLICPCIPCNDDLTKIIFTASFKNYPWKDMLTSMPVWSITCAHFCENWGFYTLLTQLPSYMNGIIKYKKITFK